MSKNKQKNTKKENKVQNSKKLEEKNIASEEKLKPKKVEKKLEEKDRSLTISNQTILTPKVLPLLFSSIILVLIFIISFQFYIFQSVQDNTKTLEDQEKNLNRAEENLVSLKADVGKVAEFVMRQNQQQEQPKRPTSLNIQSPDLSTEYFRGNPDAEIVLVEYSDYACPFCSRVHPTLQSLIEENSNLAWVYRDYPVINPETAKHAEAAYCGGKLGGNDVYWNFIDAMLTESFEFGLNEFKTVAKDSNISVDKFVKCYESGEKEERVLAVIEEAYTNLRSFQLGTPTTVVYNLKTGENRLVVGALPKTDFETAINQISN